MRAQTSTILRSSAQDAQICPTRYIRNNCPVVPNSLATLNEDEETWRDTTRQQPLPCLHRSVLETEGIEGNCLLYFSDKDYFFMSKSRTQFGQVKSKANTMRIRLHIRFCFLETKLFIVLVAVTKVHKSVEGTGTCLRDASHWLQTRHW